MRSTLPPPPPLAGVERHPFRWRLVRWIHIVALLVAIAAGIYFGLEGAGAIVLLAENPPAHPLRQRPDRPVALRRPGQVGGQGRP